MENGINDEWHSTLIRLFYNSPLVCCWLKLNEKIHNTYMADGGNMQLYIFKLPTYSNCSWYVWPWSKIKPPEKFLWLKFYIYTLHIAEKHTKMTKYIHITDFAGIISDEYDVEVRKSWIIISLRKNDRLSGDHFLPFFRFYKKIYIIVSSKEPTIIAKNSCRGQ